MERRWKKLLGSGWTSSRRPVRLDEISPEPSNRVQYESTEHNFGPTDSEEYLQVLVTSKRLHSFCNLSHWKISDGWIADMPNWTIFFFTLSLFCSCDGVFFLSLFYFCKTVFWWMSKKNVREQFKINLIIFGSFACAKPLVWKRFFQQHCLNVFKVVLICDQGIMDVQKISYCSFIHFRRELIVE